MRQLTGNLERKPSLAVGDIVYITDEEDSDHGKLFLCNVFHERPREACPAYGFLEVTGEGSSEKYRAGVREIVVAEDDLAEHVKPISFLSTYHHGGERISYERALHMLDRLDAHKRWIIEAHELGVDAHYRGREMGNSDLHLSEHFNGFEGSKRAEGTIPISQLGSSCTLRYFLRDERFMRTKRDRELPVSIEARGLAPHHYLGIDLEVELRGGEVLGTEHVRRIKRAYEAVGLAISVNLCARASILHDLSFPHPRSRNGVSVRLAKEGDNFVSHRTLGDAQRTLLERLKRVELKKVKITSVTLEEIRRDW